MTDRRGWHFEKSVSLSHLLTSLAIVGSGAVAYGNTQARMAVLENQAAIISQQNAMITNNQNRIDAKQDAELNDLRQEVNDNYKSIVRRMDEMIGYVRSKDDHR